MTETGTTVGVGGSNVVHAEVPDPRRWFALVVIAIAQLMVILDASIVNIALPHAALPKALGGLGISKQNYQWAVTAYLLNFGGLLLLGGRIGDYVGRKKVFMFGLAGFAGASLLGGFSQNQQMLFGARALQGVFGALLAPAALSLISVTFTDSRERARAFGVYGALSGVGAAIGLIAGGLLTQYASWRWCLFVNTPMAIIALSLAKPVVRESKVEGNPHYDVPGALTATLGMVGIVYGVTQASIDGWGSSKAWPFIALGAVLLASFFAIEARVKQPLLPLRLILDRVRAASYLTNVLVPLAIFGMFLFLTFYFQNIHSYSAVKSGLLFLPFSLGVIVSAGMTSQLLPRVGPRPLATIGCLMGAGGMWYLSFLKVGSTYATHMLPPMLIMSFGLGFVFVSVASTALFNVAPDDSGAASAVLATAQQVGGSFGTAIESTIYVSSSTALATALLLKARHGQLHVANLAQYVHATSWVHGYDVAFRFGAVVLLAAAGLFFFMANVDRHHLAQHDQVPSA
ncbi:MAG TPA: MFS transporter [Acidimicrobiales bacterium]|nr:MFS transporter [Acidimicrobiales bacterium]